MVDQKLILKEWIKDKLSGILKFEIPDDMADHVVNMNTDEELEIYLKNLLNSKDIQTKKFIVELLKRRNTCRYQPTVRKKSNDDDAKYRINQKQRMIKEEEIRFDIRTKTSTPTNEKQLPESVSNSKKKNKFVKFYTKEGETVLLKGRYLCNCEAKKHKLINNCLTCGRIVCEQEGSGPCSFCGTLVCTSEEQLIFNGDTGNASKLYEQLLMKEKPKGLDEALKQRDQLLEFDRNRQKHTHVFDDDSDYFCSVNPWLTLQERDEVKKKEAEFLNKKHTSRLNKKIILKLEGNKITEEEEKEDSEKLKINNMENQYCNNNNNNNFVSNQDSIDSLIDPYFSKFDIKFKKKLKVANKQINHSLNAPISRIMDTEIHQLKDEGYCISIHQPWASFLVHGIRMVEGRTWYTSYRGKLWIASTGLRISRQEAQPYENTYRLIKGEIKFPADYPSGCLLGSVDLIDCLTQEQYRIQFPDGEVEDPYVFICENFNVLSVRYPVKGKSNIYKLDEKIHKAAVTCMKTIEEVLSESEHRVKLLRP